MPEVAMNGGRDCQPPHGRSMNRICRRLWESRIWRYLAALPILIFVSCTANCDLHAQQEPKQESKTEPKIEVNVKAVVRDKHGKIVPDLAQDAFVLEEDGRLQTINYFAKESDLPLRLGLL